MLGLAARSVLYGIMMMMRYFKTREVISLPLMKMKSVHVKDFVESQPRLIRSTAFRTLRLLTWTDYSGFLCIFV